MLPDVPPSYRWENHIDRAARIAFFVREVAASVPTLKVLAVSRVKPEQRAPSAEIENVDEWDLQERKDGVVHGMWWRLYGPKSIVLLTREEGERARSNIIGVGRSVQV